MLSGEGLRETPAGQLGARICSCDNCHNVWYLPRRPARATRLNPAPGRAWRNRSS